MLTVENVIQDPTAFRLENGRVYLHEDPSANPPDDVPPVRIIQEDQEAHAHFYFRQRGWMNNGFINPACTWVCSVFIEQLGQGEVAANPTPVKESYLIGDGQFYSVRVPIRGLKEGVYKVVATLMLRGPGNSPTPLAAYEDLGILQVYKDI